MKSPLRIFGYRGRTAALLSASLVVVATTAIAVASPAFASSIGRSPAEPSRWGSPFLIDPLAQESGITAVSCPSTTFCAAVDGSGDALIFNGVTWKVFADVDSNTYGLWSVSCPDAKFCLASDADGFQIMWNGKKWSPPKPFDPDPSPGPNPSVSCASPDFCAAVDGYGYALVWRGKSWSHTVITGQYGINIDLQAISCLSSRFCLAVGSGYAVTWNGHAWSKPRPIGEGAPEFTSVSCTSTRFCVAAGDGIFTYNGSSWTFALETAIVVNSVSCPSSAECFAAGDGGQLYSWNKGSAWKTGENPVESSIVLSCPATWFCVAGTGAGQVLFYAPPPQITTASLPAGRAGKPYSARLHAAGGTPPYSFRASGLPRGLKIAPNGVIAGTPAKSGHFLVKVAVTDPLHESSTRKLKLTIT